MKTQEQQNERSEQLNDIRWKKRNDALVNIIRQSRGRPTLTGQGLKTENKTILNTLMPCAHENDEKEAQDCSTTAAGGGVTKHT